MADRMDQLIAAAVRQGFLVKQNRTGSWMFAKGIATLFFHATPRNSAEWMRMINTLRGAGLRFPDRR